MSQICFSRSLLKINSNSMILDGSFHAGSEWLSDLGIGETCEAFHSSGSSPSLMEMLNSSVTNGVIFNAVSLSILAEMSPCSSAFVVSSVESRLAIYLFFCAEKVGRTAIGRGMWKTIYIALAWVGKG